MLHKAQLERYFVSIWRSCLCPRPGCTLSNAMDDFEDDPIIASVAPTGFVAPVRGRKFPLDFMKTSVCAVVGTSGPTSWVGLSDAPFVDVFNERRLAANLGLVCDDHKRQRTSTFVYGFAVLEAVVHDRESIKSCHADLVQMSDAVAAAFPAQKAVVAYRRIDSIALDVPIDVGDSIGFYCERMRRKHTNTHPTKKHTLQFI